MLTSVAFMSFSQSSLVSFLNGNECIKKFFQEKNVNIMIEHHSSVQSIVAFSKIAPQVAREIFE